MQSGKVLWFNPSKGFGVILTESGESLFVHYSSIKGEGYKSLNAGQEVEFDLYEEDQRRLAKNVSPMNV